MKIFSILALVLTLASCGGKGTAPAAGTGSPVAAKPLVAGDPNTPVAQLNGEAITQADLDNKTAADVARLQTELFEIQKNGINGIVEDRLLAKEAKSRGITVEELLKVEVRDKVGDVSDQEVADFYNQNKPRFGAKTLDEVKAPLKAQLIQRKSQVYRKNFMDRLTSDATVVILLKRPTVEVSADDDPFLGGKNAPVTIIEFTDYQCPFCGRARPTVKEVIAKYGDKVKYVLRDYPLEFHPNAQKAAEAAQCANDQGKYWEYSDILWANQQTLQPENLKKYAGEAKLDTKKFDECLDSGKYTEEVKKDFTDGAKAGVNGTPSFFINGQSITGARPIEDFQEIIDEQLRLVGGKQS